MRNYYVLVSTTIYFEVLSIKNYLTSYEKTMVNLSNITGLKVARDDP